MKEDIMHFFVVSTVLVFLAYLLQSSIIMSPDVSYLIHAAWVLFQGGHYVSQIFETNPPMILYLYLPIHLLVKIVTGDIVFALRLYILTLSLISFGTCFYLLQKVIPRNRFYRYSLSLTLLWVLFLLPLFAFGQREHLWIILTLPYLFTMALFFENQSISRKMRFVIGLFGGLGFALKPFFIIPFIFLELYAIFIKRSIFAVFRIESLTIVGVILSYLISIYIWQPEYIDIILPYVFKYYFPFFIESISVLLLRPEVLFCFGVMIGYLVFYSSDRYKAFGATLWLTSVGMTLAYLIPRQTWYYHFYPAMCLAYLLSMHCLTQLCSGKNIKSNIFYLCLLSALFYSVPLYNYYALLTAVSAFKKTYPILPIEKYINTQKGERSIYCFSLFTSDCFPLVYSAKMRYAERFSSFWWYKGISAMEKINHPSKASDVLQDKKFLIDSVSEDLNQLKARWVIVNEGNFHVLEYPAFDLIDYFSQNDKFREAWKNYHYLQKMNGYRIYEREN